MRRDDRNALSLYALSLPLPCVSLAYALMVSMCIIFAGGLAVKTIGLPFCKEIPRELFLE